MPVAIPSWPHHLQPRAISNCQLHVRAVCKAVMGDALPIQDGAFHPKDKRATETSGNKGLSQNNYTRNRNLGNMEAENLIGPNFSQQFRNSLKLSTCKTFSPYCPKHDVGGQRDIYFFFLSSPSSASSGLLSKGLLYWKRLPRKCSPHPGKLQRNTRHPCIQSCTFF